MSAYPPDEEFREVKFPENVSPDIAIQILLQEVNQLRSQAYACRGFAHDVMDMSTKFESVLQKMQDIQQEQSNLAKKQDELLSVEISRQDKRDKIFRYMSRVLLFIGITLAGLLLETLWDRFINLL